MNWTQLYHLGDPLLTLPASSAIAAWLLASRAWRAAFGWMFVFGLALGLVAATKIAFMGWATGLPALQFKAVSGHATGFAAVFPTLCWLAVPARAPRMRRLVSAVALLLAAVVAVGLVHADEHTLAEVVAGWLIGSGVFACTVRLTGGWSSRPGSGAAIQRASQAAIPASAETAVAPTLSASQSGSPPASQAVASSTVPGAKAGATAATTSITTSATTSVTTAGTTAGTKSATESATESATTTAPARPAARPAAPPPGFALACAGCAFLATAWVLHSAPLNYWMIKMALVLSGNPAPVPWDHCG